MITAREKITLFDYVSYSAFAHLLQKCILLYDLVWKELETCDTLKKEHLFSLILSKFVTFGIKESRNQCSRNK